MVDPFLIVVILGLGAFFTAGYILLRQGLAGFREGYREGRQD